MAIAIPPRPPSFNGNPEDKDYAAQLQAHQEAMMVWQMTVQAAQNEQNQETTTASNMQKGNHDALMNIARNVGG